MQNGAQTSVPVVKYVGHKVSKVRWKPQPSGAIENSDTFVSGSCEDEPNRVCVWQFAEDEAAELAEPQLVCECEVPSDLMDLKFLDEQRVVGSFSNGCVAVFRYKNMVKEVSIVQAWEGVHYFKSGQLAPCSSLGVCKSGGGGGGSVSLVTGGEDGRINVLRPENQKPIRVIDNADNATITSLACTMQMDLLSTSSSGQLKIWDLRSPSNKPTKTIVITSEYVSLNSMDRHPHQPHLVALGRSDGSVCFLDLRQERAVQIIQAHSSEVWDVCFHPTYSNHLFTCSQDGSLWHWDASLCGSSGSGASTSAMGPAFPPLPPSSSSQPFSAYPPSSSISSSSTSLLSRGGTGLSRMPFLTGDLTNPTSRLQQPPAPTTSGFSHTPSQSTSMTGRPTTVEETASNVTAGFGGTSPWLSGAIQQGKVEIVNLFPENRLSVNSLDIESQHLVCGTDGEALFIIPNLTLT